MSETPAEIYRVAGGDTVVRIDDGQSVQPKLRGCDLDPVELNEHQAEALAETLTLLAQRLRSL
ncbi:hypothetical protein ACI2IY_24505 [Lysobacter enzymogenes]|uniref:hypothetical protein n=1 Tax=Lysobacter enzymogenes TaxID=69 RepID=UPI00384ECF06